MKLKIAKKYEAKEIAKLFSTINRRIPVRKVIRYINEKKIYVLKDKKKIKAAFSFSIYGIVGICSFLYIHKLAVTPDMYGQGLGTLLLARIKLFAMRLGIPTFVLFSIKRAIGFYKKNKLHHLWRFFWWRKS